MLFAGRIGIFQGNRKTYTTSADTAVAARIFCEVLLVAVNGYTNFLNNFNIIDSSLSGFSWSFSLCISFVFSI